MNTTITIKRLLAVFGGAVLLAVVLVACGGGGSEQDAVVQEAERAHAQGLLDKLPVSWKPNAITFSANPGFRQDVPVTLTTTKALTNAKIVFVPDLRNAVTVIPDTIPALAAGQSATVTLRFAPAATDTRKVIAGIALLFDKNATTSQPLLVKISIVAAETINGIAVPPEPPPDLNNATLAGFDVNGNGVRDDVERLIARNWPSYFANGLIVAKHTQLLLTQDDSGMDEALTKTSFCILARKEVNGKTLITSILNNNLRYSAYISNVGLPKIYGCN
ncbi:MAG: hypothetical protein JSS00_04850 [Proteobacteria bacterium]|nr:hypothetical protein [Pseudomonadota bacterium]